MPERTKVVERAKVLESAKLFVRVKNAGENQATRTSQGIRENQRV